MKNDWEKGVTTDIYVLSDHPGVKSEYYFLRDIPIGTKNQKREMRIVFQSLEIEENEELLHLLHRMVKP
jgi:hypothetical protein